MKPSRTSKGWMREHVNDTYVQRARREGYRARSAYKLMEIDSRDRLLRPGSVVVDLGAAPGGWSQVVAEKVGRHGLVLALDLLEMVPVPGVTLFRGDFSDPATQAEVAAALPGGEADLVLSDISPNMSGIVGLDQARSQELAELALEFAARWLKPDGAFLVKVFHGVGFEDYLAALRAHFTSVATRKPSASRDRSREVYLLARGVKARPAPDAASGQD